VILSVLGHVFCFDYARSRWLALDYLVIGAEERAERLRRHRQ